MLRIGVAVLMMLEVGMTPAVQVPGPYRLNQGDTLSYREVSSSMATVQTSQGDMTISSEHDATIALVSAGAGRATAWYEALRLRSVGPNGEQSPATEALLGRPFSLSFPGHGSLEATQVPAFPESVTQVTDLRQQFADFFVRMPSKKPGVGDMWQDTVGREGTGATGGTLSFQTVRRYRSLGDTVVSGTRALVIEVSSEVKMESTVPMRGQPVTVVTRLAGEEGGVVLFDWTRGRLLARSKSGKLKGVSRLEGSAQPIEFPQSMSYESRISIGNGGGGA